MVNRKDFTKVLAEKTGYNQRDVAEVLANAGKLICEYAKAHETVKPMDGFVFEGKTVAARTGRNPQTGETIEIPEKTKIVCRFGKSVKDSIQ